MIDDLRTPSFILLTNENVSSNAPIQEHEFPIHRQRRLQPGTPDALLQVREERGIRARHFFAKRCSRWGSLRRAASPLRGFGAGPHGDLLRGDTADFDNASRSIMRSPCLEEGKRDSFSPERGILSKAAGDCSRTFIRTHGHVPRLRALEAAAVTAPRNQPCRFTCDMRARVRPSGSLKNAIHSSVPSGCLWTM